MRDDCAAELQESETRGEPIADWWERAHTSGEIRWLSDYSGEEVWNHLGVESLLVPGVSVLEIGVGTGRGTRALKERGCDVSALDISSVALGRVAPFAKCYLPQDRLPSDTFDVAISHLVAQHMADVDLVTQMRAVVAALKPNGVFAVQYSAHEDVLDNTHDESSRALKLGEACRTPEQMERLVSSSGARVVKQVEAGVFSAYRLRWYVVHLTKAEELHG